MVTAAFFVLFTAFMSCSNLSSNIMKDLGYGNLGILNISIIYFMFAFSSMIAVPINKALGTKLTFVFGSMCYVIWIAGFILPAKKYELVHAGQSVDKWYYSDTVIKAYAIGSSFLVGVGAGPLWVS